MPVLNFPLNPFIGQRYTLGTKTYVWNGTGWAISELNPSTVSILTATQITITTSTNSTSTTTGGLIVNGGVGIGGDINAGGDVTISGTIYSEHVQIAEATMDSTQSLVTNTNATIIDQYYVSQFRTAKYLIQIDNGDSTSFEAIEMLLMVTNTGTVKATDYGLLQNNGELGTFASMVDDNGGNPLLKLYFTANAPTNKTIKVLRTALTS
jgi:hypothetical protein